MLELGLHAVVPLNAAHPLSLRYGTPGAIGYKSVIKHGNCKNVNHDIVLAIVYFLGVGRSSFDCLMLRFVLTFSINIDSRRASMSFDIKIPLVYIVIHATMHSFR